MKSDFTKKVYNNIMNAAKQCRYITLSEYYIYEF